MDRFVAQLNEDDEEFWGKNFPFNDDELLSHTDKFKNFMKELLVNLEMYIPGYFDHFAPDTSDEEKFRPLAAKVRSKLDEWRSTPNLEDQNGEVAGSRSRSTCY